LRIAILHTSTKLLTLRLGKGQEKNMADILE